MRVTLKILVDRLEIVERSHPDVRCQVLRWQLRDKRRHPHAVDVARPHVEVIGQRPEPAGAHLNRTEAQGRVPFEYSAQRHRGEEVTDCERYGREREWL